MRSLIRIAFFVALFTAASAWPQEKGKEVEVKDTAADRVLNQLAKDHTADQAAFNVKLQQARSALDQSNKSLSEQLSSLQKTLNDKLKEDKKYKDLLAQITSLSSKLQNNGSAAEAGFQKDIGPLQQKLQQEAAQIEGLTKVVREENGLPANALFDPSTLKWTVPSPAEKK